MMHRNRLGVRPGGLVFVRKMAVWWDFRRGHVRTVELRLRAEPAMRLDNREIVAARFVEPQTVLAADNLPPFIRAHLGEARPCGLCRAVRTPMGA